MQPNIDALVRLKSGIPDLDLHPGEIGTVRSTWFAPAPMYEVEFHPRGCCCNVRSLLHIEQIELVEQRSLEMGR